MATGFDKVVVPARGSFQHAVVFPELAVPAVLHWSFSTEGKNIRFGLFKRSVSNTGTSLNGSLNSNNNNSALVGANGLTLPARLGTPPGGSTASVLNGPSRSVSTASKLGIMLGASPRAFSFPAAPTDGRYSPSHNRSTSVGVLEIRTDQQPGNKPLPLPPSSSMDPSVSVSSSQSLAPTTASTSGVPSRRESLLDFGAVMGNNTSVPSTPSSITTGTTVAVNGVAVAGTGNPPSPAIAPATGLQALVSHSKAVSSNLLNESGLVQLVPITHAESSKLAVRGSWLVAEQGEYVLYWDNSFSVQTPKKLTYVVSVSAPGDLPATVAGPAAPLIEGWISKKRSKKMQGWAKRWFRLLADGTLEYSEKPATEVRGVLRMEAAVVTLEPKNRRIDVDSGSTLFHLKCFSEADYQAWTAAFERFDPSLLANEMLPPLVNAASGDISIEGPRDPAVMSAAASSSLHRIPSPISLPLRLSPLTPMLPSDAEPPYDILKREIQRLSDAAARAPPDLEPTLRSIQAQIQKAAESILLATAPVHISLGRLKGRAASILSAATGYSDEKWFDAEEGEESEEEEESSYGSDEAVDNAESSSASSAVVVGGEPVLEPELDVERVSAVPTLGTIPEIRAPVPMRAMKPRRTMLPIPGPCESPVSIMSILRQNMGKDLSTVSMPIGLNEPLSALQRLAEEFEYAGLLHKAAGLSEPLERLAFISAFAVSGYASTLMRAGRKPFNPLLAETYELVMPERKARFLAEKVGHHPPVLAYKAESFGGDEVGVGWEVWGDQQVKSKFWGKTMEFLAVGSPVHVLLKLPGGVTERYTFNRLTSCMRNLIGGGSRYLEHIGELRVTNHRTGQVCSLTFKEQGYFGSAKNEVVGSLRDENGREAMRLTGRWDELISKELATGKKGEMLEVLWRPEPFPAGSAQKLYGFTGFAIGLNDITQELEEILPRTDSRLRPDQRLFEEGQMERAEAEKTRLENKQREARKEGREARARWFELSSDEFRNHDEGRTWTYAGGYWEAREKGQWPEDLPDIF